MNLLEMINDLEKDNVMLDEHKIPLKVILKDNKYNILLNYLNSQGYEYSNDIKKLNNSEFNKLKMEIPSLMGVGEYRINMYISKLEEIRRKKYSNNMESSTLNYSEHNKTSNLSKELGSYRISKNWRVCINHLIFGEDNEFIDIRQIKDDGTRGKGISIKKNDFNKLKAIINSIDLSELKKIETKLNEIKEVKSNLFHDLLLSPNQTESNMIFPENKKSLKELILENENKLYNYFKDDFGLAIRFFKAKISDLKEDGDIVKFLENPSILEIKKEQYNKTHNYGLKTAIDIKNEYDKTNLKYTTLESLNKGDLVNSITICCIANNFNQMFGMYYDEDSNALILKSQIQDGPYEDRWIKENEELHYCLQMEPDENCMKLSFSKLPNKICKNIILGYDLNTKVYLFYRYNKNEDYIYAGEVKLKKFTDNNRAVILNVV